ncbi:unnamed protein product [Orchesella dallaii]|uniref:Secreted protein n=1 Tax=Orchesella dallaii TaxID=48710 RepID=A0ABP1RRS7_9HEXA
MKKCTLWSAMIVAPIASLLFADINGDALCLVSRYPKKSKQETRNDVTRNLEFVALSFSCLHSEKEESLAGNSNRIEEEGSVTCVSVEKGHVLNQQQQNSPTRLAPASSSLHAWTHTWFVHNSTEEENCV